MVPDCVGSRMSLTTIRYAKRKSLGLCVSCGSPTIKEKTRCAACAEKNSQQIARATLLKKLNGTYPKSDVSRYVNKERRKEYMRRYNKKDKLRTRYGITVGEYNLLLQQTPRCPIRVEEFDAEAHKPHSRVIDHCHTTGTLRGLICHYCNLAIGFMNDDSGVAEKIAIYLKNAERHP